MAAEPNIPNPSRRLFLAAGSVSAVFGALATAAAQDQDPVFAAIEHHKAAYRVFEDSCHGTDEVAACNEGRAGPGHLETRSSGEESRRGRRHRQAALSLPATPPSKREDHPVLL